MYPIFLLIIGTLFSCSDDTDSNMDYEASFTYSLDADNTNTVNFTNTSEGNYLYVEWDFGNGETTGKSTDKNQTYSVYYPEEGTYSASLTLWGSTNQSNDTQTITQEITIENDDPDYYSDHLLWSEEFNTSSINSDNWTLETGDWGWGNNELQEYTDGDNLSIEDGILKITAKKVDDNKETGSYTSTRMITKGKQEFTYGRMEIRAKLPSGTGIWPAIWMLGADIDTNPWPACGELDIMEYVGYDPNIVHSTIHTTAASGSNGQGNYMTVETCEEDFHIYGMLWTAESILFYVDSEDNIVFTYAPETKTEENWPFDKPQFFILNVAVGGNWGGTQGIDNSIFSQTMEVDYIRVYEL